jgi:hypothetical protein
LGLLDKHRREVEKRRTSFGAGEQGIINPELSPQLIAAQFTGVDVSDPQWRAKLSSHVSAFLVDCRSVPDIIQSCFGLDSKFKKWVATLSLDEQRRRNKFKRIFRNKGFAKLPLSRARVDTVHRQGFADIWIKVGKRYYPLQESDDVESG